MDNDFASFTSHEDRECWPPRCCYGCLCGTGDSRGQGEPGSEEAGGD